MALSPCTRYKVEVAGLARQLDATHVDQKGVQFEHHSPQVPHNDSPMKTSPYRSNLGKILGLPPVRAALESHLLSPARVKTRSGLRNIGVQTCQPKLIRPKIDSKQFSHPLGTIRRQLKPRVRRPLPLTPFPHLNNQKKERRKTWDVCSLGKISEESAILPAPKRLLWNE